MSTETTTPTPEAPAPQKVVLLGKEHDITAFASNDPTRFVINSVHYNEKAQCLEATNGRFLIRVPVEVDTGDFPTLSGKPEAPRDVIIPIAPFKKALASIPNGGSLDILKHVALTSVNDGLQVRLTTNDLDTENNVVTKRIDGNYPATEQVIPTKPATFAIALDPSLLKTVVEYFAKHNSEQARAIRLEFTELDDKSPVRITGTLASGKQALAILMPMRLS